MKSWMEIAAKAVEALKLARNLQGATASRVTRTQAGANLVVCLLVAGLAAIPGSPLADFTVAIAAVTFLVPTLGPLLSRMFGRKDHATGLSVSEVLDEVALILEEKEARALRREEATELVEENRDSLREKFREVNAEAVRRVQARKAEEANHGTH